MSEESFSCIHTDIISPKFLAPHKILDSSFEVKTIKLDNLLDKGTTTKSHVNT